jgi:hypothetical protein
VRASGLSFRLRVGCAFGVSFQICLPGEAPLSERLEAYGVPKGRIPKECMHELSDMAYLKIGCSNN